MTQEETKEWEYRVQERLGIMAGEGKPTPRQTLVAMEEAYDALEATEREARAQEDREPWL